jgi:hypothetical protein
MALQAKSSDSEKGGQSEHWTLHGRISGFPSMILGNHPLRSIRQVSFRKEMYISVGFWACKWSRYI